MLAKLTQTGIKVYTALTVLFKLYTVHCTTEKARWEGTAQQITDWGQLAQTFSFLSLLEDGGL